MNDYLKNLLARFDSPSFRIDAKFTAVLEKQLEYVKSKTYDIVYAEMMAYKLIPVSHEADSGAETITYQQWDSFGVAQIIANYGDDLPAIDAMAEDFSVRVKSLGASYSWSIQDLRRAVMAGVPLSQRKASAAKRAIEQKIENVGAFGDSAAGLTGLSNNANASLVTPITGTWSTATGQQMIADVNKIVQSIVTTTAGTFPPNTIAMDTATYALFSTTPISTTGDTSRTVLQFFLDSSPYITEVTPWHKLELADAGGTGPRLVCYHKSPEVLEYEIPQPFESFPPQSKGLTFSVPCHARIGGVVMYRPMAVAYMDGL